MVQGRTRRTTPRVSEDRRELVHVVAELVRQVTGPARVGGIPEACRVEGRSRVGALDPCSRVERFRGERLRERGEVAVERAFRHPSAETRIRVRGEDGGMIRLRVGKRPLGDA